MDWRRLKAVVLESDDWGLCAWVPDDQAHRALAVLPAFRSPAGLRYGRSTLESAADVTSLAATLLEWRGGDGFPPVLQANTIVANPDYEAMSSPLFEATRHRSRSCRTYPRAGSDPACGMPCATPRPPACGGRSCTDCTTCP